MSLWQTMDTAPADGRQILGYDPTRPEGAIAVIAWRSWAKHNWGVIHDHEDYVWLDYNPTHWQPLPAPPETQPFIDAPPVMPDEIEGDET